MKLYPLKVGIIDIGIGNLGSIKNMLKRLGVNAELVANPRKLSELDKIVLPGVGHFDHGMNALVKSGFKEALDEVVNLHCKPVLGVCLGAQMLGNGSEEGNAPGLGYIDMECTKFVLEDLPVPHMGWNALNFGDNKEHESIFMREQESRFYFVHSYRMECNKPSSSLATTNYGGLEFTSLVGEKNIYGAQFHPEKSLKFGKEFLRGFVEYV